MLITTVGANALYNTLLNSIITLELKINKYYYIILS